MIAKLLGAFNDDGWIGVKCTLYSLNANLTFIYVDLVKWPDFKHDENS